MKMKCKPSTRRLFCRERVLLVMSRSLLIDIYMIRDYRYVALQTTRPKHSCRCPVLSTLYAHLHSSNSKICGKFGVPNPVTGSHPFVTGNPSTPQLLVFPAVMSVKPLYPWPYNHGFRKPRVGLPEAMRASFTSATTEDIRGQEAEVPEMVESV
jgi:hypothetical protein